MSNIFKLSSITKVFARVLLHQFQKIQEDARRRKREKATKRALDEETPEWELEIRIAEHVDAFENNYSPPRKTSRSVTPNLRSAKKPEPRKPATRRSRSTNSQPRIQESRYRDQESPEPRPGPSGLQETRIVRQRYCSSTDEEELEKRRQAQLKADAAYANKLDGSSFEDREVIFSKEEEEIPSPQEAQRYQGKGKALAKTPVRQTYPTSNEWRTESIGNSPHGNSTSWSCPTNSQNQCQVWQPKDSGTGFTNLECTPREA